MELKNLPVGTLIYVDTNIFLYAISDHPQFGGDCNAFFDRAKMGEIHGEISVIVLNELIHKLIIGEIAEREGLRPMQVLRRVKANRLLLQGLTAYEAVKDVEENYNLKILGVRRGDFIRARALMQEHGLISNDALHVAVMRREKIHCLATKDTDFDGVTGLQVWKPG